jgi:hypothetical protein
VNYITWRAKTIQFLLIFVITIITCLTLQVIQDIPGGKVNILGGHIVTDLAFPTQRPPKISLLLNGYSTVLNC